MLNQQKPEPQVTGDGFVLDVHSIFYTIQGEGPFTGERAVFVRLAGCNLQCPWCDTEYTQGRDKATAEELVGMVIAKIRRRTDASPQKHLVVITGGEPFRQPIGRFMYLLLEAGLRVQIESNGVLAPDEIAASLLRHLHKPAYLICSPKTSRIHPSMHELATVFKYVLHHENIEPADGLPIKALGHKASPHVARPDYATFKGRVYVNPEDSKDPQVNAANIAAVKRSALRFGYIAGVQLHKILDVE